MADLMEVVNAVEAPYRAVAFERLFEVVLTDARGLASPSVVRHDDLIEAAAPSTPLEPLSGSDRFQQFLSHYGVSPKTLAQVVDFDSGHVLARNLGSSKAEKTRTLAALLALINARKGGVFQVGREELVSLCNEHDSYDRSNFAKHMSSAEFNGSRVFIPAESGGYRVSVPGEAFVAAAVKLALPAPVIAQG